MDVSIEDTEWRRVMDIPVPGMWLRTAGVEVELQLLPAAGVVDALGCSWGATAASTFTAQASINSNNNINSGCCSASPAPAGPLCHPPPERSEMEWTRCRGGEGADTYITRLVFREEGWRGGGWEAAMEES